MNIKNKKIILSFDLDYTLIDNTKGIVNSFQYALKKHAISNIDENIIKKMIGIPLNKIFSQVSDINPSILSASFREFYATKGIYQVKLYSGVREKLHELSNDFIMGVITSKKQEMAVKLLKHLKINHFFDYIIGENEEIKSKQDPKLKQLLFSKYQNHEFVIIGDHPKDKLLSDMLNCPFIGVLTGHHSKDQLIGKYSKNQLILKSIENINKLQIYSLFDNKFNNLD
ncbi:MAG: HAD family hydrolase [Promethearchaeota archaeon]